MMLEWLKLTDLLVVLGFSGTILAQVFRAGRLAAAITSMQVEITSLKDVAKTVADVLTTVAIQKVEIAHIRNDIEDLKHGRGLIVKE